MKLLRCRLCGKVPEIYEEPESHYSTKRISITHSCKVYINIFYKTKKTLIKYWNQLMGMDSAKPK
jgi:hypothetical protein